MLKATSSAKPPAVCVVRQNYYPDTHVRRDAEALAEEGYDVSVVSLRRPGQLAREVLNGVTIYRLPMQHRRGSILRYAWEYSAFLFLAFMTVTALHAKKSFRIVEVDNMPDTLVLSALLPKLTGARVILYIFDNMPELLACLRNLDAHHPIVRFLAFIERLSARFAHRVVVTQEMARRVVEARGVPPEKVSVVLNSADEALFGVLQETAGTGHDGFEIVTHGAILKRYGVQVLIDALPKIAAEVPGVTLHVFGEGEYCRDLQARVQRNGVAENVRFRGFVPFDELIATLAGADVGYVGMLNDLMLSNKLMEYVALGVPAVVARWPTFEHYFDDDSVAYFRAGDSEDLAATLIAMYRDAHGARERAERAWGRYQRYRWAEQRQVYLGIYTEMLGTASNHRSALLSGSAPSSKTIATR